MLIFLGFYAVKDFHDHIIIEAGKSSGKQCFIRTHIPVYGDLSYMASGMKK